MNFHESRERIEYRKAQADYEAKVRRLIEQKLIEKGIYIDDIYDIIKEWDESQHPRDELGRFTDSDEGKEISETTSGALNSDSDEAEKHAKQYYESVRHMTTDCKHIAQNTGFTEEEIQSVKDYIFMEKHDLGNGQYKYFYPSYDMAQSWQRLIDGKNIQPHDLTMIRHELMERRLMKQGLMQVDAHKVTSKIYNYRKESDEYNAKVSQHKKNK